MDILDITEENGMEAIPRDTVDAMAYVPYQKYSPSVYMPYQGIEKGTMFKSLNKPFYGKYCDGDVI